MASEQSPLFTHADASDEPADADVSSEVPDGTKFDDTFYKAVSVLLSGFPGVIVMAADGWLSTASYVHIGSEFKQMPHMSWFLMAYGIGVVATQPLYSRFSDEFGRKPLLLTSYGIFGMGSLACSLCYSYWPLVLARGVVGIGAAGMTLMLSTILNDIIPPNERAKWQIPIQLSNFIGGLVGGGLGGHLVDKFGWQWPFRFEPFAALILIILVSFKLDHPHQPISQKVKSKEGIVAIDFLGAILLLGCLVCLVLALSLAGNDLPWSHPLVYSLLILSAASFGIVIFETRHATNPFIPSRVVRQCDILGTAFFSALTDMSILYLVPFYIEVSGEGTVMTGGLLDQLFSFGETIVFVASAFWIQWSEQPWYALTASRILAFGSAVFMASAHRGNLEKGVALIVAGGSSGATNGALMVALLKSAREGDKAIMYGVYHIAIAIGNLSSAPIVSSILVNETASHLKSNLNHKVPGDLLEFVKTCLKSLECLDDLPESAREQVQRSFLQSIRNCYVFTCMVSAIALLIAVFTKRPGWLDWGDHASG